MVVRTPRADARLRVVAAGSPTARAQPLDESLLASALFREHPDPMLVVDPESLIVLEANEAAAAALDRALRPLVGTDVGRLWSPADRERVADLARGLGPGDRRDAGDLGLDWLEPDEEPTVEPRPARTAEVTVHGVVHGRRPAALLVLRGVDPAPAAWRDAEQLSVILAHADLAYLTATLGGVITRWSAGAERLFGWRGAQIVGQRVERLSPPDLKDEPRELAARVLHEERVYDHRTRRVTRDGRVLDVAISVAPIRDGDAITGLAEIIRDVSHETRLEAQLRQSQKMEAIGRLAGGLAHDFNNLLTAILGYSDLLLDATDRSDPRYDDATQIRMAAERATALTRQLLAFSRRQSLHPATVPLNDVVEDFRGMLDRLLGGGVSLVVGLDPDAGAVRVDRSQLEQVVLNLAINGRDAMPDGGTLLVETARVELDEQYARSHPGVSAGTYGVIAVSDEGVGLTEEAREHLFEPFFTTKPAGAGTGLGLATVYGIVHQSGGHVSVYSQTDVGTTFRVYLPSVDEEVDTSGSDEPGEPPRRRPAERRATILVVDDEPAVLHLMAGVLSARGHVVIEAPNAAAGLHAAERHDGEIELLVTDVVMPGTTGPRLAAEVRAVRPSIRVLLVSGYSESAIALDDPSRDDFLEKPFTPDELVAHVEALLATPAPG
jgi:two-component system, cell cycle sensor histidine kinase and response regulator CckA